ncbi:MAG TPA: Gfo/Idh/MocA family oxidoreductase [bacterium]|nr:Gfo/Idh/MocA family oxidoreductase [bacterium]HPO51722.1 Gfo/Idh/MocA family oxidoreductase [bacterium]
MKTKIAVVGLGIGQAHLQYYSQMPDVEIVGAMDVNSDVLKQVSEKFGVKTFSSVGELLDATAPDGVSICTPPATHLKLTQIFAKKGIHILCEKPMAPRVSDCEKMIDVCERNNVFLMLGFKKRFSPTYRFLKENFENDFGQPKWVLARFALGRVEKQWFWDEKDGGGPIIENTVHMIDLLHFLCGRVKTVYAEGGNLFMPAFAPQIDTAIFTLRFENDAIAGIGAGYASEWGFAKEQITFATDRVVCEVSGGFDRPRNIQYIYRNNPSVVQEKYFEQPDGFPEEIRHFVDCIRNNTRPAVGGEEGLYALKVCRAVKKSIIKRKPVSI